MRNAEPVASEVSAAQAPAFNLDELERRAASSKAVAWALITGLPALGVIASLSASLPLFAALMAGAFLLATALVCRHALAWFASQTLRLLVAARLVIVLVVAALLFCTTGAAWMAVTSAVLLWLVSGRLLGKQALTDLGNRARHCHQAPEDGTAGDNGSRLPLEAGDPLFPSGQEHQALPADRQRRSGSSKR